MTARRMGTACVTLPLRTVSEANTRGHWSGRARRAREQRSLIALAIRLPLHEAGLLGWREHHDKVGRYATKSPVVPLVVTLTRIAPRVLDDDNLRGACKGVRDGVADAMATDDRDPLVEWRYAQRRGRPREYAVEVRVERANQQST